MRPLRSGTILAADLQFLNDLWCRVDDRRSSAHVERFNPVLKFLEGVLHQPRFIEAMAYQAVLEAAGSSMNKVIKVTIFMTDLDHSKAVNAIYAERFSEPFPARTTIGVARLPLGATIEIDVVASL